MKIKDRNKRFLTVILLAVFVIGFSLPSINHFVGPFESNSTNYCFPGNLTAVNQKPVELIVGYETKVIRREAETNTHPLALLFQILFILFLISPPIIALLLFCIWKELKKRNELK